MNVEDKHDESEPEDPHPTDRESEQEPTDSPDLRLEKESAPVSADLEEASTPISSGIETPEIAEVADQQPEVEAVPSLPVEHESQTAEPTSAGVVKAASKEKPRSGLING